MLRYSIGSTGKMAMSYVARSLVHSPRSIQLVLQTNGAKWPSVTLSVYVSLCLSIKYYIYVRYKVGALQDNPRNGLNYVYLF